MAHVVTKTLVINALHIGVILLPNLFWFRFHIYVLIKLSISTQYSVVLIKFYIGFECGEGIEDSDPFFILGAGCWMNNLAEFFLGIRSPP